MKPHIKIGLAIGIVGFVPSFLFGFTCCVSPILLAIIVGGVAGYISSSLEEPASRDRGAEIGAVSSIIAGAMVTGSLFMAQLQSSLDMNFGISIYKSYVQNREILSNILATQVNFLVRTVIATLCIDIFILALTVAAGAVIGFYRVTPKEASMLDTQIEPQEDAA
jgi:hypothetical protein